MITINEPCILHHDIHTGSLNKIDSILQTMSQHIHGITWSTICRRHFQVYFPRQNLSKGASVRLYQGYLRQWLGGNRRYLYQWWQNPTTNMCQWASMSPLYYIDGLVQTAVSLVRQQWGYCKSCIKPLVCVFPCKTKISLFVTSKYRNISNIRRTLVGNKIVAPVGAAPTTSSFST